MKEIHAVRTVFSHVSELLPQNGTCTERDLGVLIANCCSAIHFSKSFNRASMSRDDEKFLDCYLQTAIHLRDNALRALNSEKIALTKEQVAEYFAEFFFAAGEVVNHCRPEAIGMLNAARCG